LPSKPGTTDNLLPIKPGTVAIFYSYNIESLFIIK
jgi:hypothetical protein